MTQPSAVGEVALVVVTWNSERVLPQFLASIPEACAGISQTHLVVADNASSDASPALARAADATVIDMGRNAGYAAGVNAAVAAAPGARAYLVLNPDTRLTPGCVSSLLAALDADPRVGIVVPRLVDFAGQLVPSLRREPTVLRAFGEAVLGGRRAGRWPVLGEMVVDERQYETRRTADWASGAAMMISRACLDAVGPWDERFFLYSEETDFALRARDAGFRLVYEPAATIVHGGGEVHASERLWSMLAVNRVRCYRRRHGAARTALFRSAVVINESLRAARAPSRAALAALLVPSRRPVELRGAS